MNLSEESAKKWDETRWFRALKFAEAWHLLNVIVGFSRMHNGYVGFDTSQCRTPTDEHACILSHVHGETEFESCKCRCGACKSSALYGGRWSRFVIAKAKTHQMGDDAYLNVERVFADRLSENDYHVPKGSKRDRSIKISAPHVCVRCGKDKGANGEKLHRDHILALWLGGKDEETNLQWLCVDCHKFKSAEEDILHELDRLKQSANPKTSIAWKIQMWKYRLQVLREKNPPGSDYRSYYGDLKTHREAWATKSARTRNQGPASLELYV